VSYRAARNDARYHSHDGPSSSGIVPGHVGARGGIRTRTTLRSEGFKPASPVCSGWLWSADVSVTWASTRCLVAGERTLASVVTPGLVHLLCTSALAEDRGVSADRGATAQSALSKSLGPNGLAGRCHVSGIVGTTVNLTRRPFHNVGHRARLPRSHAIRDRYSAASQSSLPASPRSKSPTSSATPNYACSSTTAVVGSSPSSRAPSRVRDALASQTFGSHGSVDRSPDRSSAL
jgi:hypothetical protein